MKGLRLKLHRTHDKRVRVINRLKKQLKDGTKPTKEGIISLTATDEKRIKKELATIEDRTGY